VTGPRAAAAGLFVAFGLACSPVSAVGQRSLLGRVEIGRVEHRVRDGGLVQPSSGTVLGAALGLVVGRRYEVWGEVRGGRLAAPSAGGDDRDLAEVELRGEAHVNPWLTAQAGATVRSYTTPLARQRWSALRLGAEARIPLGLESIHGMVRGQWLPATWVSGLPRPGLALAAGAGVEWQGRRWSVSALYALERYDFPASGGTRRLEELSALRLRGGLRLRP
jgi:hypothetical protein